jgi:hypothetical protein
MKKKKKIKKKKKKSSTTKSSTDQKKPQEVKHIMRKRKIMIPSILELASKMKMKILKKERKMKLIKTRIKIPST